MTSSRDRKFRKKKKRAERIRKEKAAWRVKRRRDDPEPSDLGRAAPAPPPGMQFETERMFRRMRGLADPDSPSERAQELAFRAMDTDDSSEALRLAEEALSLDADCVDALHVRALSSASGEELLERLTQAVEAGERTLGKECFTEHVGHFWGLVETRPYLRARHSLGEVQWRLGHRTEAMAQYEEMLVLCPSDNLGVRDPLIGWLLAEGELARARRVLERFEDDALATMAWARVAERVLADDHEGALEALATARERNPHAERFLAGRAEIRGPAPEAYRLGSPEEAVAVASALTDISGPGSPFRAWLAARR
ncbi:MAG: hypothetical protein ACF8XB_22450 [Planctomycetota bacterium JB042]